MDPEPDRADDDPAGALLPDGTYDVFVVDATEVAADAAVTPGDTEGAAQGDTGADGASKVMHLELTITSGEHKGRVLGVAARGLAGEDYELLGMPATLTIIDGIPAVRIDA